MIESYTHEFIDLNKFDKIALFGKRGFNKFYEVLEKNENTIYLLLESYLPLNDFNENKIISLSREVNTLSQVTHPSILKFYGYSPVNFEGEPRPIIVTEFPSNNTLKKIFKLEKKGERNIKLDDTKKLIIIYGIAAGMSFLHSKNIIHRDLKQKKHFF